MGGITVDLPDAYPIGSAVARARRDHDGRRAGRGAPATRRPRTRPLAGSRRARRAARLRAATPADRLLARATTRAGAARDPGSATGASVELAPTEIVAGTVLVPSQPAFDEADAGRVRRRGRPSARSSRTARGARAWVRRWRSELLPAGFRIVISENAEDFDHARPRSRRTGPITSADATCAQGQPRGRDDRGLRRSIGVRRRDDRRREGLHRDDQGSNRLHPPSTQVAVAAARAAADKQATDIVVLDVREVLVITDLFVICTAGNPRQLKTVIEAIEERDPRAGGAARPARGRARRGLVAPGLHRRRRPRLRARAARLLRPRAAVARRAEGGLGGVDATAAAGSAG